MELWLHWDLDCSLTTPLSFCLPWKKLFSSSALWQDALPDLISMYTCAFTWDVMTVISSGPLLHMQPHIFSECGNNIFFKRTSLYTVFHWNGTKLKLQDHLLAQCRFVVHLRISLSSMMSVVEILTAEIWNKDEETWNAFVCYSIFFAQSAMQSIECETKSSRDSTCL